MKVGVNMFNDFELIQYERLAAFIGITAYIILLIASDQSEAKLIAEETEDKSLESTGDPSVTTAIASFLLFLNTIILANNAFVRLYKKKQDIINGKETDSIVPNINISTGFIFGIIGNSLRLLGALQKASESGDNITIL